MPEITFNQAKEFLDNINKRDKIAIITHDDLDGFASGILLHDWCKKKGASIKQFTFTFGKWDKSIDITKFNKILITDVAPVGIEEINLPKGLNVFYTDHHPNAIIPKDILELRTTDKGYIPSSRTVTELTQIKPWLGLAGTIADSGNLYSENRDFIDEQLKKIGMTFEEFKENISNVITNFLIYFHNQLDEAFEILKNINSIEEVKQLKKYSEPLEDEIQKFVEEYEAKKEKIKDVNFYYFEPKFSIKGPVSGIISHRDRDEIYIFASPKKGNELIALSARNTSKRRNMAELLRVGITKLKNSSAGGHPQAAGGQIQAKDLEKFKQNIRNFVESNPIK